MNILVPVAAVGTGERRSAAAGAVLCIAALAAIIAA
ncbi:hypothetical protein EKD16_07385 [Streptomonospora litoralis]|uniref:Uncharacterized protein n=1 Tax=Streptomonospora litoralis TaxID=2498135 RepID=A0A4P6PYR2_9ACTN|nr:hypothetical protein EKD16_07385 [Streptomonospora litoralis]